MTSTGPDLCLLCMCWILSNLMLAKSSVATSISKFECSSLQSSTPFLLSRNTGSTVARSIVAGSFDFLRVGTFECHQRRDCVSADPVE